MLFDMWSGASSEKLLTYTDNILHKVTIVLSEDLIYSGWRNENVQSKLQHNYVTRTVDP